MGSDYNIAIISPKHNYSVTHRHTIETVLKCAPKSVARAILFTLPFVNLQMRDVAQLPMLAQMPTCLKSV